ncbi:MAG: hypothetical protein JRI32_09095, partial [Deltaproteobacteria bacterium]|nr:hypothetical protein [Deltaproteobacteria bacterium]
MSDTKAGKLKIAGLIRCLPEKGQNAFEGLASDIRLGKEVVAFQGTEPDLRANAFNFGPVMGFGKCFI